MRRVATLAVVVLALLAFAPTVVADTTGPAPSPRESYTSVGFDASTSACGAQTCTDTFVSGEHTTTDSGDVFTFVCVDQFTYNVRTGRGSGQSGCNETADLTVARDLSRATLAPTDIEACGRQQCDTLTVSAELVAVGDSASFRGRFTEKDGTCTFTYSESGERQAAEGSITFNAETLSAEGAIRSSKTTFASRCR
jgi:hypothetical protein